MSEEFDKSCTDCPVPPGEERQRYPRRFYLYRIEDKTGISGTGVVADGVVWQTGAATLNWRVGVSPTTLACCTPSGDRAHRRPTAA